MDPVWKLVLWTIRLKESTTLGNVKSYLFSEKVVSINLEELLEAADRMKKAGLIAPRQLPFQIPLALSFAPLIFTLAGRVAARDLPDDPRPILEEIRNLPESRIRYREQDR